MVKRAFLFPGQGKSVIPGMGKDLADCFHEAKEVFQEVDDALDQHLFQLMCEGPESDLTLTENAQPALMALGIALCRVLEKQSNKRLADFGQFVAGHSLGEYSALTAMGMFSLKDAALILKKRGLAMQNAVAPGLGAMAALLGGNLEGAKDLCKVYNGPGICEISNDNAPNQIVISGHKMAIDDCIRKASDFGFRRAILLPVSAPFHCALMIPAAKKMEAVLNEVDLKPPFLPMISNVTAKEVQDPQEIKELLIDQMTKTVRWRECTLRLGALGVSEAIEMGTGKVLSGLVKAIQPEIYCWTLEGPKDIEHFIERYPLER